MALIPPNGALEVVFSFDTTGSMYSCLEQVRGRIKDMIQRLQCDIPGIRTAVFAHGDYCDTKTYVTKWLDFTTDVAALCDFVTKVKRTYGGDSPECYELVLHRTRTLLSWTPGSRRVLVLIGDDEPHGPEYHLNKDKIDWKHETKEMAREGVTIYPVQCGDQGRDATAFYKTLATVTGGKHLKLDDFGNLFDVLMAVCYREGNDTAMLASYEKEVRARWGSVAIGSDIDAIFASLRDGDASAATPTLSAPPPSPVKLVKTPSIVKIKSPAVKRLSFNKATLKSPLGKRSAVVARRAAKKASLLDLYRQSNLPLLKRENVPETNFGLRTLTWSPWTLVVAPDVPDSQDEAVWEKRRGMTGYRLKCLKSSHPIRNADRKVLFEVSVQTPGSGKQRHVVYSGFSTRCLQNRKWESCLLGRVRVQINKLVSDGCKLFLRFHSLSAREDVSSLRRCVRRYDYAWKPIPKVRTQSRPVTKGAHQISMTTTSY